MSRIAEYHGRRWRRFYPQSRVFRGPMPALALINVAFAMALFMTVDSAFVLKPADLGSKSIAFGGRREIGFDGFPEFSRRYRVSCDDEGAIRRTLNGSVLKYFEGIPASLTLEGRGGTMLMYFESRLATPEEMQSFMEGFV